MQEADEVFAAIDEILGQPTVHLAEGAAAECREIAAACRASFVKMVGVKGLLCYLVLKIRHVSLPVTH